MKAAIIVLLLISCCICASTEPECEPFPPFELISTFQHQDRMYQVAFIEREDTSGPWPIDLVMRWRKNNEQQWHEAAKIAGVRPEKVVTLSGTKGEDIEALVVSSPGGSAQFISVVEVTKKPPGFEVLLNRELDKGGFDYRFDVQGRLIGFKFNYFAWHVSPFELTGHVYTASNIGWDPAKQSFQRGPIYVDDQREQEADLADILLAIGADYLLSLEESYDESTTTYTFIYKPEGLLWRKTPPEFRSAEKVRVQIRDGSIIKMEAAG